jgi:hypothetical protein
MTSGPCSVDGQIEMPFLLLEDKLLEARVGNNNKYI